MALTTPGYGDGPDAAGAWVCPLRLPSVPVEQVRAALGKLAEDGHPVAAMVHGDPVVEVVLYRDPSGKHGTPSPEEASAAAQQLADATGWELAPELAPRDGVLVGMGLREGYGKDATVHEPGEVAGALSDKARCRETLLVSGRLVDGQVRWYEETGVAIEAGHDELPRIAQLAADLVQDRYVETDLGSGRTGARKLVREKNTSPAGPKPFAVVREVPGIETGLTMASSNTGGEPVSIQEGAARLRTIQLPRGAVQQALQDLTTAADQASAAVGAGARGHEEIMGACVNAESKLKEAFTALEQLGATLIEVAGWHAG